MSTGTECSCLHSTPPPRFQSFSACSEAVGPMLMYSTQCSPKTRFRQSALVFAPSTPSHLAYIRDLWPVPAFPGAAGSLRSHADDFSPDRTLRGPRPHVLGYTLELTGTSPKSHLARCQRLVQTARSAGLRKSSLLHAPPYSGRSFTRDFKCYCSTLNQYHDLQRMYSDEDDD